MRAASAAFSPTPDVWAEAFRNVPPRMAFLMQLRIPIIIFTDNFCEVNPGGKAADGAIILDGASGTNEVFGQELWQEVVRSSRKQSPPHKSLAKLSYLQLWRRKN